MKDVDLFVIVMTTSRPLFLISFKRLDRAESETHPRCVSTFAGKGPIVGASVMARLWIEVTPFMAVVRDFYPSKKMVGVLSVVLIMFVSALLGTPDAQADPYPVDGGPDRGNHGFCFDPNHAMNAAVRNRAVATMSNVDAQTVVTTARQASCGTKSDVVFQQRPLPNNWIGYAPCARRVPGSSRCDSRHVRIYWGLINSIAVNPNLEARATLCHEVGHTLGLNHYESWVVNPDGIWSLQSCMTSELSVPGNVEYHRYGPHHVAHINNYF